MTERMPTDPLLDADLSRQRLNVLAENCRSSVRSATTVTTAREDPIPGLSVSALFPPLRECVGNMRIKGHRFLRGFSLAWPNNTTNNGSSHVHRSLLEINVEPFETKQLALA